MYKVFGQPNCVFCKKAVDLLTDLKVEFVYYDLTMNQDAWDFIKGQGFRTVPQIYKDEEHIGGYKELKDELGT